MCLKLMLSAFSKKVGEEPMQTVIKPSEGICAPDMTMLEYYTQAVDVWAVGIVAYQLLFNMPPFQSAGRDSRREEEKVNFSGPNLRYPPNLKQTIPAQLKKFLSRSIEADDKRRATIDELVELCQQLKSAI